MAEFKNPFKPGAGQMPPYLAGRSHECDEFMKLLEQETILENLILTGLRGVGKTVLLDTFKPLAIASGWLWVGTDLSESASVSEFNLAIRLLTDLSIVTSTVVISTEQRTVLGFTTQEDTITHTLDFRTLVRLFEETPGLIEDKLKHILEFAWQYLQNNQHRGVIFAYDEAQNLADNAEKGQFPLSVLLSVFQSLQKKGIPFMLALTGLPTLFGQLVEARTFAERMFRVIVLNKLNAVDSREAIVKPIEAADCPVKFRGESVELIIAESGGYPYFIQFICREVYDVFIQQIRAGGIPSAVPVEAITRKLDSDFFAGRWARATDRQRDLLYVIAVALEQSDNEFTVQEVVAKSEAVLSKPFTNSHVNQMLAQMCKQGLTYKNRHGKYSLAVPLLDRFVCRQYEAQNHLFN